MAGYAQFKSSSKQVVTSDQIGPGQVKLEHLDPGLFQEIRQVALHAHKGTGSRKIDVRDLNGSFGVEGFYVYSSDGTKKYQVQVNSATDAFVLTQV